MSSSLQRTPNITLLISSAFAAGANGLFIETNPNLDDALSDGANMIPLAAMPKLLATLLKVQRAVE